METAYLDIKGMHCGMCANGIQMMLSVKEGVKSADISWDSKKGVVEYDPDQVTIEEILDTVASTGEYSASVKKEE